MTVGVVTHEAPDLSAPYFVEALAGLREGLAGLDLFINPHLGSPVEGLVFLAPETCADWIERTRRENLPAVVVNGAVEGLLSVDLDNAGAARSVADHLLVRGYRRLGLINGKLETANGRDRRLGFLRGIAESPLEAEGGFSREGGRRAMETLLKKGGSLEAVFAANDHMALGAWDALRAAGKRVPEDLALVGFDDIPEAAAAGLTTVRQPVREMARWAGVRLADAVKKRGLAPAGIHLFQGTFVTRSSISSPDYRPK
jgi:LacI family transcriptional regulator